MKNITLLLLLITTVSFSQINVVENEENEVIGEVSIIGTWYASIERSGDNIIFLYKDVNYQHISEVKSFAFKDVDNALDTFYNTIKKGLDERSKEDVTLDLPNDKVTLVFQGRSMYIYHTRKGSGVDGRTLVITQKKLDKLFGR
jgi:hypothetical protein